MKSLNDLIYVLPKFINKMKKVMITATLFIGMMASAMVFSSFTTLKGDESAHPTISTLLLTNSNNDDWERVGVMEISKIVGNNASATQKVQVYNNSDGNRAVKDRYGYHIIEENRQYGRYPKDECPECGYRYKVFYEGDYWYTQGIVKRY